MKRTIIIIISILLIGVVGYGIVAFWLDAPNQKPVYPVESESNKILVTSNACCAMVYGFKLTLHNKQTNEKRVICTAGQVSEMDVFKYKIPEDEAEDFEIILSCDVYYGDTYSFEKTIVDASNYDKFKNSGLLIYFQESDGMYINIITNNKRVTYKLSCDQGSMWELRGIPNEIFPGN